MPIEFNFTTLLIENFLPSDTCWQWCSEQSIIHQNNIQIQNLYIVVVAVISLFLNHVILNYSDWIIKHTEIKQSQLEKLFIATSYFPMVLLLLFLLSFVV